MTPKEVNATPRPSVTIGTCQSLTQHPLLTDATNNTTATTTQQTMYDTRTNINLTQYPLGETEMNTILEQSESVLPDQDTVRDHRTRDTSDNVTDGLTTTIQRPSNKTNSVENEYGLKETTIETFDSPEKDHVPPHQDDIFYTPAKGLVLGGSDNESSLSSGRRAGNVKSSISSTSKEDGGSLKEADLKSLAGETSAASPSSASLKSHSITNGEKSQHDDVSQIIDDGEPQTEDIEEDKDEKESNDMMEQYMQMIHQKKNDDKKNNEAQQQEQQVCENYFIVEEYF